MYFQLRTHNISPVDAIHIIVGIALTACKMWISYFCITFSVECRRIISLERYNSIKKLNFETHLSFQDFTEIYFYGDKILYITDSI